MIVLWSWLSMPSGGAAFGVSWVSFESLVDSGEVTPFSQFG